MITREVIEQVKEKTDLVTLIEGAGIRLTQRGINFIGLCPFHDERTPSFNVRTTIGRYHCFGCGESGDAINFIQQQEGLTFQGAVEYLADKLNIKIDDSATDEQYKKLRRQREILKEASNFFRENYLALPDTHPAKQNLSFRNLQEVAEHDETIGYAPAGQLISHLNGKKYATKELLEVGLVKLSDPNQQQWDDARPPLSQVREIFRNRLMWTVKDVQGNPIGFSGRVVDPQDTMSPKYVNSPQSALYNKSRALLGIHSAKKSIVETSRVFVVEGQTDVMALQAVGATNVVASCGTAFGEQHVDMLTKLTGSRPIQFVFCFDTDKAGQKAATTVFEKNPHLQLTSQVVVLTEKNKDGTLLPSDPSDYRLRQGDTALLNAINSPIPILEFILGLELAKWDMTKPEEQSLFVQQALQILKIVKDKITYDSYLKKISEWAGVLLSQILATGGNFRQQQTQGGRAPVMTPFESLSIEEKIIAHVLQHKELSFPLLMKYEITPAMFDDEQRIIAALDGEGVEDVLNFVELNPTDGFSEDRVLEQLDVLLRTFAAQKHEEELNDYINEVNSNVALSELEKVDLIFQKKQNTKQRHKPI